MVTKLRRAISSDPNIREQSVAIIRHYCLLLFAIFREKNPAYFRKIHQRLNILPPILS